MNRLFFFAALLPYLAAGSIAPASAVEILDGGETSLTVYNQNFAVIRNTFLLELKPGTQKIRIGDVSGYAEPASVILRDIERKALFDILEQSYEGNAVSEGQLLSEFEGKELDFATTDPETGRETTVKAKVLRSAYTPVPTSYYQQGAQNVLRHRISLWNTQKDAAMVEIGGEVRFGLPGRPIFPKAQGKLSLKPELVWDVSSRKHQRFQAEMSYVSGGLGWEADYNIVARKAGGPLAVTGWVTVQNSTGKDFKSARVKLMAGDVHKISPTNTPGSYELRMRAMGNPGPRQAVATQKAFDGYHLYELPRKIDLLDLASKQVRFIEADGVVARRRYIYDGIELPAHFVNYRMDQIRANREFGQQSNPKVWIVREFENTASNKLGVPLPKGRLRFFLQDDDGQLELTGEDMIDHTPANETVRVYTGNDFDLIGSRRQTHYYHSSSESMVQEKFEIEVRNRKSEPVSVTVVEHLYRSMTWEISQESKPFRKLDSTTIEFELQIPANGAEKLEYTVTYTW